MALNAYLTLTGETQGKIEGDVTEAGREGMIEVNGWNHEVLQTRDAASGLPTGKRQHKPLTITKRIDKSSPLLMNILVTNENITNLTLELFQASRTGAEEPSLLIELVNATVADIRIEQLNNKYPENTQQEVREHVSFTYQRIVFTWLPTGSTAEDTWTTERA